MITFFPRGGRRREGQQEMEIRNLGGKAEGSWRGKGEEEHVAKITKNIPLALRLSDDCSINRPLSRLHDS